MSEDLRRALRMDDPNWRTADGLSVIAPLDVLETLLAARSEPPAEGLPVGAILASALMAANYPGDSGEDVDRLIAELAKRGYRLCSDADDDEILRAVAEARRDATTPPAEGMSACDGCGSVDRWLHIYGCKRYYGGPALVPEQPE